jgi:hypothetical protein
MTKVRNVLVPPTSETNFGSMVSVRGALAPVPSYQVEKVESLDSTLSPSQDLKPMRILNHRYLLDYPDEFGRSVVEIEIACEDQHYQTGGHIVLIPESPRDYVQEIARLLKINLKQMVVLNDPGMQRGGNKSVQLPTKVAVKTSILLRRYLDLCAPPSRAALAVFSAKATNAEEASTLFSWSLTEGDAYVKNVLDKKLCLIDVFSKFRSIKADLTTLLDVCPLIGARSFSVATSPLESPNSVKLCGSFSSLAKITCIVFFFHSYSFFFFFSFSFILRSASCRRSVARWTLAPRPCVAFPQPSSFRGVCQAQEPRNGFSGSSGQQEAGDHGVRRNRNLAVHGIPGGNPRPKQNFHHRPRSSRPVLWNPR